jgi:hypothetical protein
MENSENQEKIVFSKTVKAGKRTYFFDAVEERESQLCLHIKESLKVFDATSPNKFRKFSIRLYKENFEHFASALQETIDFINSCEVPYTEDISADDEFERL